MPPIEYPVIVVGDLHGQREWLEMLLAKLRTRPEWPTARVVFLGDLVDRGPDVPGTVQLVMDVLAEKPGSTCVMGNHDLALVRAAGLDEPASERWITRYRDSYDHEPSFLGYLGRVPAASDWRADLRELRDAMPAAHREFLATLPWVAEAAGHVFVHNGLSPHLDEPATVQLELLRRRRWNGYVTPTLGGKTHAAFNPDYPVWLGADKTLSADPLPVPGKVIVSGHVCVSTPDANAVRIRLDTSGGIRPPLTACVLTGPSDPPVFVGSHD